MAPLKCFLSAGDRIDDVASGGAIGLSLATPVAQAVGFVGDAVPDMSITSAIVLTLLTLGRMYFGHLKAREEHRHREAVLKLEVEKALIAIRRRADDDDDEDGDDDAAGAPDATEGE